MTSYGNYKGIEIPYGLSYQEMGRFVEMVDRKVGYYYDKGYSDNPIGAYGYKCMDDYRYHAGCSYTTAVDLSRGESLSIPNNYYNNLDYQVKVLSGSTTYPEVKPPEPKRDVSKLIAYYYKKR